MTQIDITTPAIISRCEHIEHCALGGSHKDAERMRALAADRDQALARERALLDSNQEARDFLKERDQLRGERDDARVKALNDAQRAIALADPQQDLDPRDPAMRDNPYLKAWRAIEDLKSSPAPHQTAKEALPPIASAEILEQCKQALLDNYRYGMGVMLTAHHIPTEQFVATNELTVQEAAKVLLDARNRDGLTVLPDYVRDMLRALTQEEQANG